MRNGSLCLKACILAAPLLQCCVLNIALPRKTGDNLIIIAAFPHDVSHLRAAAAGLRGQARVWERNQRAGLLPRGKVAELIAVRPLPCLAPLPCPLLCDDRAMILSLKRLFPSWARGTEHNLDPRLERIQPDPWLSEAQYCSCSPGDPFLPTSTLSAASPVGAARRDGTILVDPPAIAAVGAALDAGNSTAADVAVGGLRPGRHLAEVLGGLVRQGRNSQRNSQPGGTASRRGVE